MQKSSSYFSYFYLLKISQKLLEIVFFYFQIQDISIWLKMKTNEGVGYFLLIFDVRLHDWHNFGIFCEFCCFCLAVLLFSVLPKSLLTFCLKILMGE